jgi:hypothetical protein
MPESATYKFPNRPLSGRAPRAKMIACERSFHMFSISVSVSSSSHMHMRLSSHRGGGDSSSDLGLVAVALQ